MSWIDDVVRDAETAVARMPPEFVCAAQRSGTVATVNQAAWESHRNGSCGCPEKKTETEVHDLVQRLRDALVSEDYEDSRWTELLDEADRFLAS